MRFAIVDAFTDRPFAGNPAGVCLLEGDWPDAAWMQQVAAELSLPMTAFARPDGDGAWGLRWFTPLLEERLCGHATLATAHVLQERSVRFETLGGTLAARAGGDGSITLDFPAAEPVAAPVPDGLAGALGAQPIEAHRTGALRDLVVVLESEAAVRGLAPRFGALADFTRREDIRGVVVTAAAEGDGYDFVSRFFSPADGIPEDPVTGSAHTALAPYWSRRLGSDELVGVQASARGGVVRTAVRGDRVHLGGRAVTVLEGTLHA